MFSAARMLRVTLIALERDKRALLRGLGLLGVVELRSAPVEPNAESLAPRDCKADLTQWANLLARIAELRRSLGIPPQVLPLAESGEASLEEYEQKLRPIEERVRELLKKREALVQRSRELALNEDQLSNFCGFDIPLDRFQESAFLHFMIGSLPGENFASAQKRIDKDVILLPLLGSKDRQSLIAIGTHQSRDTLKDQLQLAGFRPERFPPTEGRTVDGLAEATRSEQKAVTEDLKRLNTELQGLAEEAKGELASIELRANVERLILQAEQKFLHSESTVLLTGWTPAADADLLRREVETVTLGYSVIELTKPVGVPEKEIPVLVKHSALLRPFQRLVAAYGLPNYQEIEPTLFMACTYFLMFGMMFGDAGQGMVLALGGAIALMRGKRDKMQDLGVLLLWVGISSIIFGVVYGSYFGIPQLKPFALWHDPLEGTSLLMAAIAIGVVVISLGLVLNIINRFRYRDLGGGFFGQFGLVGVLFYWGVLALTAKFAALRAGGWVKIAILFVVVLPIASWIIKGIFDYRSKQRAGNASNSGSLALAIIESLVVSFETVLLYFANTVSFVRLAAYAMSHAALLVATFTVAAQVSHFPHAGTALSILVIIAGNVVAIVLEGIIAAVQGLRLEFYEFFGKFFSGEGQPFTPFRLFPRNESEP